MYFFNVIKIIYLCMVLPVLLDGSTARRYMYKLQNQTVYRHLSTPPTDHILLHHRPPTAVTVILFVLSGFSFSFRFVLPCLSILFGSLGTFRGFS